MKPLLKITFNEPFYICQDSNIMALSAFILTKDISRNKHFVKVKDYTYPQSFSYSVIKSIEFINPTELQWEED